MELIRSDVLLFNHLNIHPAVSIRPCFFFFLVFLLFGSLVTPTDESIHRFNYWAFSYKGKEKHLVSCGCGFNFLGDFLPGGNLGTATLNNDV